MVFKNKYVNRFWRFSTSFELGIPILIAIAVLIAAGTIVESRLDAYAAKRLIYESWMMYITMVLLIYNLTIVMVDRWPWKPHHYPFIFVHIGIIIIILGGYVTQKFGVDGSVSVQIKGQSSFVSMPQTDLVVYATFDGDRYTRLFGEEVDFFMNPPTPEKPYLLNLGKETIRIIDYVPYARLTKKVKATTAEQAGASIRFQLMNPNVKQVENITQIRKDKSNQFNLGPARVVLGKVERKDQGQNEIFVTPLNNEKVSYSIFRKDQKTPFKTGQMQIGDVVQTGWMGLEFRLLDYLPRATEEWDVTRSKAPTPLTTAAVFVERGADKHWLVLNDVLKIFSENEAFLVSYQNRRLELGFPIALQSFKISRYQGTMKAMAYESEVKVGMGEKQVDAVISMNEPLKYSGYTIYQASFQEDEVTREPTASIFSVNYDPGRWIKYWGSAIMSFGMVWLFYQRRKRKTAV